MFWFHQSGQPAFHHPRHHLPVDLSGQWGRLVLLLPAGQWGRSLPWRRSHLSDLLHLLHQWLR